MESDTKTSIRIDGDIWKEAKIEAIKHNKTLQQFVKDALRAYIDQNGEKGAEWEWMIG